MRAPRRSPSFGLFCSLAVLMALSACGGGGGGSSAAPTEQQQSAGSGDTGTGSSSTGGSSSSTSSAVAVHFDAANADAFYFAPAARYADLASFESDTGGGIYATWSPSSAAKLQGAGAKILFFGSGSGCAAGTHDGAVMSKDASDSLAAVADLGVSGATVAHAWMPSGATAGCSDASLSGRSEVALAAGSSDASGNALAMRTFSGPGDANAPAFLLPIPAAGQDGSGLNAYISNSSVTFRQSWPNGAVRHPWSGGEMLMHAQQSVSTIAMPSNLGSGELAQSKQQLMGTFVNTACWANRTQYGHPCQVQLIFHTTIARTDSAAFPTTAKVWFDKAQGGMLIVSGLIPGAAASMNDDHWATPIYTSYGSSTRHAAFGRTAFDVGVTIAQLRDILRIGTAHALGVDKSAVTDDIMAANWGASWGDASAWALVTANATQEIYNNSAAGNASIDGQYYEMFVGPKG